VILNVRSGRDRRNAHTRLVELLFDSGVPAQIFPVGSEHGVRAVTQKAAEDGHEVLVAAGGDGTVSAVASVAVGYGKRLGVLPMGTFNHFARDLGIPAGLADAVVTLKSPRIRSVDMASVNGRAFLNTSSIGLYPRLVLESEHYRRSGFSRIIAVVSAAISTIRQFRPVYLRLATAEREWVGFTPFVFVGNNEYLVEGSRVGSRARLDAGTLWVCTTFRSTRWGFLRLAAAAWLGRAVPDVDFHAASTTELRVESGHSRLFVSLDGEVERLATPLRYTIHHCALEVIVP
jgi:diacylglycerol kinase family enzyme